MFLLDSTRRILYRKTTSHVRTENHARIEKDIDKYLASSNNEIAIYTMDFQVVKLAQN